MEQPLKTQTLDQVREAFRTIEEARDDINLSEKQKFYLETVSVQLRNTERSLVRKKEQELVSTLTSDSRELKEMAAQLKASAEKMEKVAKAVEKVSKLVELLIKAVSTGLSSGIL